jgi:hypothetical protein
VHGHHVLDLNRRYGIDGPSGDERDLPG